MANMISVRIPARMIQELREAAKEDHYLDLSEAVRSIVRDEWMKHRDPFAFHLQHLRKEISENLNQRKQEELIKELEKIRDNITHGKKE